MSLPRVPRIHLLPSALCDQIAAGEVVERAASVVKELCENSLDAGARKIEVEIEAGGRRLIRVVDDGGGMTPEEARLALQRHATSKITRADDLWGLSTFGFRGEALPSIAAVSRLRLSTRMAEVDAGFSVLVEGGEMREAREVGMPPGTQIEVRDLFFNTPARQKFQKTEVTEAANVSEAVLRLAIAHPAVHFRLRSNERTALELPPHRDRAERVRAGLTRRGAGALHEALGSEGTPGRETRVHAFLGAPEDASATSRSTFLLVGQRFVRDRSLLQALAMGYGEWLERGRYPLAALFVEVPPDEVDVNVHPQKLEVRFARAQEVHAAVRHVVAAAVAGAPWKARAGRTFSLPTSGASGGARRESSAGEARRDSETTDWHLRDRERGSETARIGVDVTPTGTDPPAQGFFSRLRYLDEAAGTFLVCEGEGELVIIDRAAAQIRLAEQVFRAAFRQDGIEPHGLLFPVPIDLDGAAVAGFAILRGELLSRLGFECETFGERSLLVRAVPRLLASADIKPLLLDLLRVAPGSDGSAVDGGPWLAVLARHGGGGGQSFGAQEARELLRRLDADELSSPRPAARLEIVRMPWLEIARRIGRG